jgi:hypothetical protein
VVFRRRRICAGSKIWVHNWNFCPSLVTPGINSAGIPFPHPCLIFVSGANRLDTALREKRSLQKVAQMKKFFLISFGLLVLVIASLFTRRDQCRRASISRHRFVQVEDS